MTYLFKAISLTYKKAPLGIRELLALNEASCSWLLHKLQHELGFSDVLVLSTCNRTEVYYAAETDQSAVIIATLGQVKGVPDCARWQAYFTVLNSQQAATRHLFEVALGLDSQVVGDMQISSQVKRAYQRSAETAAAGPFLHRLLHSVLAANKQVQQETAFRDGAASTSYATLELVRELTATGSQPRVLIVGLGEIGKDVCRHFGKSKHFTDVTICNRTRQTAELLAAENGLQVLDFAQIADGLQAADVVISSLAASTPFFTRELVSILPPEHQMLFIDLSVPRSVAADVESTPGITVYNIDTIQNRASQALAQRLAAIPHVQAIIEKSMATLQAWSRELQVAPTIQRLKSTLELMRQQEVGRFQKKVSPAEALRLEEVTKALTQKFLKLPVLQLKAACQRGEAEQLTTILTELFALEVPSC